MAKCGYACINCGLCKGKAPKSFLLSRCIVCGTDNEQGTAVCKTCGNSLILTPGTTNTAGKKLPDVF